eukprot:TRINITY_DN1639_c0_g1_i1.p1 TRINITY_DN1639_c0_g1~~TRINITY_DN1639_c0_g1_i1.p1  ORF type:complete len:453 (-),score=139.19 TRINITY_DN1639_c0_g1_i1:69-1394(-)
MADKDLRDDDSDEEFEGNVDDVPVEIMEPGQEIEGSNDGFDTNNGAEDPNVPYIDDSSQGFFEHAKDQAVPTVSSSPHHPHLVLSGSQDESAYLWDWLTGGKTTKIKLSGHTETITHTGFSVDGTYCATGSLDKTVKIWKVTDGSLVSSLEGPPEGISFMSWHPKGPAILAGSEDGSTWLWSGTTGQFEYLQMFLGHSGEVSCGGFSVNGRWVVTGGVDGTVRVWDPKTGKTTHLISGHPFHTDAIVTMAFSELTAGQIATGSYDKNIKISNITTGKVLHSFTGHTDTVEYVDYCKSLPLLASAGLDKEIKIWDMTKMCERLTCKGHTDGVVRVKWLEKDAGEGHLFWSCSVDKTVRLWDGRTGNAERVWSGARGTVLDICLLDKGAGVVAGEDEGSCLVFLRNGPEQEKDENNNNSNNTNNSNNNTTSDKEESKEEKLEK